MIERAIENWLINTNERNYQTPFVQILLSQGHKVLYVSPHGPGEQGKDIISIDENGECCAYQLKTGKLNLNTYRKIEGEVKELIELPPKQHPQIDKNKIHKSFLVTNGRLTDPVLTLIDDMNEDNIRKNRQYSYLSVKQMDDLLDDFIKAQSKFLPQKIKDMHHFLSLYLSNGRDFPPKESFYDYINENIFKGVSKNRFNNAIASSVIITSHMLNNFQHANNYYAQFEAWTLLAGLIVRYAHKHTLKGGKWLSSYRLVMSEILRNLESLKKEVLKRDNFLEGDGLGDGSFMYQTRLTLVLGALAALENYKYVNEKIYVPDGKLLKVLEENMVNCLYWGESAFPFYFNLIKYFERNERVLIGRENLIDTFKTLIELNKPHNKIGLPNPYYTPEDFLDVLLSTQPDKVDFTQFPGGSYTLELMLHMLANRNLRNEVEKLWKPLSRISLRQFVVDNEEDIFTWRVKNGRNHMEFLPPEQSWGKLVNRSKDLTEVPQILKDYSDLLNFYILVCPHRATKEVLKVLDSLTPTHSN